MDVKFDLSPIELRVLCSLIEKESTTPDQYPLSTNALKTACNQKTSRDPVTDYSEADVDAAVMSLRERSVARSVRPTGSRGWKHRHVIEEQLSITPAERAVIAVLGLRGPQTSGELRQRTERIHLFEQVEEVESVLSALAGRDEPMVENIGREPGQSQDRWRHCLGEQSLSPAQNSQRIASAEFAALHESGFFAMPNPWDLHSARTMEQLGAKALATSSAALASVLGKDDYDITRDDLVGHVEQLASSISVPLHVDGEQLFPNASGGIAQTVSMLAAAGAAGVSIEDYDPATERVVDVDAAVEAVRTAVEACDTHNLVLTARCENYLYGNTSLDQVVDRLRRYADVGAGCVYAPGVSDPGEIELLVSEVNAPLNVLISTAAQDVTILEALGVRRASSGSAIFNNVQKAMVSQIKAFMGERNP